MKYLILIIFILFPAILNAQSFSANVIDENGLPIENSVVSLVSDDKSKNFRSDEKIPPVMVQQGQEFVPNILPVSIGSKVHFPNKDNFRHMIYSFSKAKRFEVQLYGGEDQIFVNFDKAGLVTLGCNIHDNMVGYVYVVETDHFAKSDINGKVQMDGLQPGTYEATVWHPSIARNFKDTSQTIVIEEGNPQSVKFTLEMR